ncbi:hypothetical protein P3X46_024185 [Hevea brasiliensis]|uniref:Uncharacterized protein n=1 Tax=Hevea brasiliensis TaxID=3981 RepID=A0ABQ9L1N6_HEVBR|nr:putative disease resistance protein At3g14460 [Hevea brasiliensis]KAJ9158620.1 hypothetical protein P3X46_024185 [Hevea brasiliensis]
MEVVTAIGGAILSVSFQELLDRLTSRDLLKYAQEGNVLVELKKWERMLKKIYLVLDDAEEKQWENPLVKMWVSDLRDLAYDAEDVLGELATEAQRRKLKAAPLARASKVWKIISTISACINPSTIQFSAEMVSKIEGISTRLDEIIKEKNNLHIAESRGSTSQVRTRLPTTSLVNESKIYGREKDKSEILELLKKEATGGNVSVIPIIGMGGIGKTTLAQLIFNDATLEFDLKAWVSVGEDFDVLRMTKTILQSVGCEDTCDDRDLNLLQIKLNEKLSQKKFLIVLDDVWTESYDHWTLFCSPFELGAMGSRIIITTRNESVSSMMGTIRGYSLKQLPIEDCLSVFAQHALGAPNFDEHLEFEEIGKEIVKRCQGLPLAAKALGGLLRGNSNRNVWEEVLNNNIWDLPNEKTNILPALRLSYLRLPSHLKQCFAYCAIFPKDYEFNQDELVLLWMAEGFINQSNKMKQMQDVGCEYFHDLLSRSFFQQSSSDKSLYVMHDLMNDLAQSVTKETCFHLGDKLDNTNLCAKIRHSSFSSHWHDTWQRFEGFHKVMGLRTFLALPIMKGLHGKSYISSKVLQDLVPKLKCLRVLSLSGYHIVELPNSIGALKHLRYLNVSYTAIKKLPESVTELFNLQTLILCGCQYLTKLPSGIGNLINLQCLDITGTDELKEMPLQIGNLANLHTLTKFTVGEDNGLKIIELKNFPHLSGLLHISGIENVLNIREAEFASLKDKHRLEQLDLEWAIDSSSSRNPSDEVQVLNSLRPPQNLLRLSIKSFGGTEFPSWIAAFTKIARLELWNCSNITLLPPFGQLPSLEELSMRGMNGVKRVGMEFYGDGSSFTSLKTLTMVDMLELEQWSWSHDQNGEASVTLPILHKLKLRNCPKLVSELPNCLQSLQELSIEFCQEVVLRNLSDLTSLATLHIDNVFGLVSLHEAHIEELVALKELMICLCYELKYLWKDRTSLDKIVHLKHLEIRSCEQLVSLVEGEVGQLPCNLQTFKISFCPNLENLPNGLHSLTALRDLEIISCVKLFSFPATRVPCSLRRLYIDTCSSLESLPEGVVGDVNDINQSSQLEELGIRGCRSLSSYPNGKFPVSIKTLDISYCNWSTQLLESVFHGLSHLEKLNIEDCPQLESFQETGLPSHSLISLIISRCKNFRSLPNQMQNLTTLKLYNCRGLVSFPEERMLPNLTCLFIYNCGCLESFPQGGLPPNLTNLSIWDCNNLQQPMTEWGLHKLASLRSLEIYGISPSTNMFDSFPNDDGLLLPTSLTYLQIGKFDNLKSISRGLQKLTSLQMIIITNCRNLLWLPEEGFPATIEHLCIYNCPHLEVRCSKDKEDYWPIISHIPRVACFNYCQ